VTVTLTLRREDVALILLGLQVLVEFDKSLEEREPGEDAVHPRAAALAQRIHAIWGEAQGVG
jgi:hypothetical protein